jgi:choice-of-anchor B domain-containing protein
MQIRTFFRFFGVLTLVMMATLAVAQNVNMQLRSTLSWPGQTLANVCGWTAPDGKEYALVGGSQGLIIVDISDPTTPVQITQLPGPNNLWKEIKTYSHYAYVTSEGGQGVQIVDLSGLPSANLTWHYYRGTGQIADQLNQIHALHIDVTKGYLYTYGGNFSHGVVHDLNADPYNPVYVGQYSQNGYIHDGYADNDTLYACHIYTGEMAMVDMTNKSNPVVLGTVVTPGKFTHNAWILSDRKHILTTDEATPSFVTSYDVSDPTNIIELDRFSIDNGNNSIGHNVHILNDYTITSWYTGGVVITDCHRPDNLVKVGQYDTWNGSGPNFDGCWGAFPYFPSGTIIASNIEPAELFILTPTYQRASYLEGTVISGCNNQPLSDATVQIVGGDPGSTVVTSNDGVVKTGQVTSGNVTVRISKPGYTTTEFQTTLTPGQVSTFNTILQPTSAFNATGLVTNQNGAPLPNIAVELSNGATQYQATTNNAGQFTIDCAIGGTYSVAAGGWGFVPSNSTVTINGNSSLAITLTPGYYDAFNLDYGWTIESSSSAGIWERGNPVGTDLNGTQSNPENDITTDAGDQCYVTGNGGGQAGTDDVDNGGTILSTPPMQLIDYQVGTLTFDYWFFNGGGNGSPDDVFEVRATNGTQDVVIFSTNQSASQWRSSPIIKLQDFITLNNQVRVHFIASDNGAPHLVEAAIDAFKVVPSTSSTDDLSAALRMTVLPNPTSDFFTLKCALPTASASVRLEVADALGRIVEVQNLTAGTDTWTFGQQLQSGLYFATIRTEQGAVATTKVVKQ